jgi:acetate kinase
MGRRVFVLNAGSSSLKYRLVDVAADRAVGGGVIEDVSGDHGAAVAEALGACPLDGVVAVAHRVVHGGDRFRAPVVVDDGVLEELRALSELAPLHNPAGVTGIELARRALPGVPHVALFDTAFHRTLPAHAYTYAVPREWGVRRYGFHGLSYAFVSRAAAGHLGRKLEETDLIVLHLGNGASAAAIAGGRSVDTSMGLTPLEGLVMGTRGGDLDPALVPHLHRTRGLAVDEIERALNSASGLRALAGAADLREVHRRVAAGDSGAAQALAVYCYRIRKYVGAYLAALGGAHAIVFTGGVGEHDAQVRARSLAGLERLGIAVDPARNAAHEVTISPPGAPVAVLVVGTDEELEMARQTAAEIDRGGSAPPPTPPL